MLLISGYEQQALQTQIAGAGSGFYRPRPKFFLLSLVLHSAAILVFALIPSTQTSQQEHPNDRFIRRNKDKIVWYHFRNRLPDVSAVKKTGTFPKPRGSHLSPQAVIAASPKPKSKRQFVWRPDPKLEIHRVPSPDLILQAPPAPSLQLPPKVEVTDTILKAMAPSLAPAPRMKLHHMAAPVVPAATRRNIAPVPAPAISPTAETGDSRANLAIASLDPARKLPDFVPAGGLPGQFSKAPLRGEPATGNTKGTASLSVPNLTVRAGELPNANEASSKTIFYSEVERDLPNATLSAPLRSSSGRIPAAIDAHFGGRNVYTIVIPVEHFSTYSSDWILWFAEANPPMEDSPSIRAPIPFRKVETVKPLVSGSPIQRRLQIAALIKADGTISDVSLIRPAPALEKPAIQDVISWKFTPATRNGAPIAVNAVIEIPFNLIPEE